MDIPWGSSESAKFVTNLGLITSNGLHGNNIMTAEWMHHVSYSPGLIAVNIRPSDATHENIIKSKEFGVNVAAFDQNVVSSVAGSSSGKSIDKIKVLMDLGVEFYEAKKIDVLMMKGAALNAECRLVKAIELGDHTMFVGEVVEISSIDKQPLVYHGGKYWELGEQIKKPGPDTLDKIQSLVEKYKKKP